LERSQQTFHLLLEHITQATQSEEDARIGGANFVDAKIHEDRMLKEQQRMDFIKAQEDDRKKLEKIKIEKTLEENKEQETKNYEENKKLIASTKRQELPPEPSEGSTIKFREPLTGNNFVRKFNKSDRVQILYDYVQSKLDEIQFENN